MSQEEKLLIELGITNYTARHLKIIIDFVASNETDCKKLLDKLGSWDNNDLEITQRWLRKRI
jgi:hypothetical protein